MPIRLTDTAIAKAAREASGTGERRDLADQGCPGLRLRLTPNGAKSWVLACRDRHGRMRRFPLGSYPAMGIGDARDEARALHARVKQDGADPIEERRRARVREADARLGVGTLGAVLDLYGAKAGSALKSWPES